MGGNKTKLSLYAATATCITLSLLASIPSTVLAVPVDVSRQVPPLWLAHNMHSINRRYSPLGEDPASTNFDDSDGVDVPVNNALPGTAVLGPPTSNNQARPPAL
ncbi:hypothetical protein BJ742DRAFT_443029 [Cladochytrium replicatum]|nr:hypothetical protein BJ742DRAFT_443029 [Cladochytrium replicatum]